MGEHIENLQVSIDVITTEQKITGEISLAWKTMGAGNHKTDGWSHQSWQTTTRAIHKSREYHAANIGKISLQGGASTDAPTSTLGITNNGTVNAVAGQSNIMIPVTQQEQNLGLPPHGFEEI